MIRKTMYKGQLLALSLVVSLALGFSACTDSGNSGSESTATSTGPAPLKAYPAFNADSAYAYVQKQVDFGPRVPMSASHAACRDWLVASFQQYGATVRRQEFTQQAYTGEQLALTNIIASYYPEKKKRILLMAHYDTRHIADKDPDSDRYNEPIPGANDGGSGVGVLLEVARQLGASANAPDVGVDIILFDGEDYGEPNGEHNNYGSPSEPGKDWWWCLGSYYWSNNKHVPNYQAYYGILLDMVGASNATFYKEEHSNQFAPRVVQKVWDMALRLNHGDLFINRPGQPVIDDHLHVNRQGRIPTVDIIHMDPSTYFGTFHHTHDDNMDIIDKNTLGAVGDVLLALLYNE